VTAAWLAPHRLCADDSRQRLRSAWTLRFERV